MAGFLHGVEVLEIDSGPRPIRTISTGVIGIVGTAPGADADAFPLDTPVLIAGSRREAARLDTTEDGTGGGTLPGALDGIMDQAGAVVICVRVEEGADEGETLANIIGGVNANTGQLEGVHALVGAESVVGHAPRILCAPGWTHQRPEDEGNPGTYFANPVVAELEGLADRMAAVVIADGPNTTDAAAQLYAGDWGTTSRIYVVDPWVKVLNTAGDIVDQPASARVAGVIARTDNDQGFWVSPSNKGIFGIIGTSRPVDFKLGDISSRANLLNENDVATIIRQDGYRLWGNRVPTSDPKWQFLCVRRTADVLNESIQRAHLWAVDRGITKTYLEDVVEGVNGFIANLVAQGALLGGECWADPDLNNAASIQNGQVWFNFDFTPVYPAERVTFRSHLVNDYISEALA
ncbi:phage tail sheath C-terminal domain-containing protein [Tritonibacter mobilis]|uniref:phage tail sheath C-terminal domain-containing protein n=1 Tax=Tritonibacter mobilis TaxID=379347 RepID=UPI001C09CAE6|nr:phage tail sheath C-terminal domain-containing protein [Tritonibacter mobilis]MBU3035450.1 phage tail sheath subtilisin-like domain-containing protein [Tritonibacter mobilis]WHQ83910.1 phage tail sheath subtilisin-like domain-containing protein [Tritonibacter mobilis]